MDYNNLRDILDYEPIRGTPIPPSPAPSPSPSPSRPYSPGISTTNDSNIGDMLIKLGCIGLLVLATIGGIKTFSYLAERSHYKNLESNSHGVGRTGNKWFLYMDDGSWLTMSDQSYRKFKKYTK